MTLLVCPIYCFSQLYRSTRYTPAFLPLILSSTTPHRVKLEYLLISPNGEIE
ncbi:hypothetical protein PIROE2DRAFT_2604 [Piromyces sp. E2]|nr:hypothetical protein PIROE2DRAFT_2604 [Piromyces sp. E2]|eukprot:OUM69507.1 hypothetical protein PIROE2DRAFT_2604 [Piromyces sp. E2]